MSAPQRVRCAVYTRKSSEEGLEQSFNSLDAQREACSAYILSQASEGWTEVKDRYDDGGLSGGTLARPALQRLLADITAGRIDIIVVYKVDRLTRSLLDFAKLVEAFDKAGTSFVSVTQSFNTTTSMGRLTLNMLLSFAQFEREVTAERIRDKIAASKARGMWMGGTPPVGYAPDGRSLMIVEVDAALVRRVFQSYLDLGNVRAVADQLERDGVTSPIRTTASTGRRFGGVPFSRGQLYLLLKNPLYIGEIHHQGRVHKALHQPIVDRNLWDRAQALLADNLQGKTRRRIASPNLLAGKLVDADGNQLIPVHATKGQTRYRYYVSQQLQHEPGSTGMRIPARELEAAACTRVAQLLKDSLLLASHAKLIIDPADVAAYDSRCAGLHSGVLAHDATRIASMIGRVSIHHGRIDIECDAVAIAAALGVQREFDAPATLTLQCAIWLKRSGRAMRLVQEGGGTVTQLPDRSLVRLLIKARGWWAQLRVGELDIKRLAQREGINPSYLTRVLRLAFLAPAVVDAILAGRANAGVDAAALTTTDALSPRWADQIRTITEPAA